MAYDLSGKRALVTGSTDGLGKLIAFELARLGATVTIHGRSEEKLNNTLNELMSESGNESYSMVLADFNKPETIFEAFSSIKQLDILVNNAGVWSEGDTLDLTAEKIIECVNVNVMASLLVTRSVLAELLNSEFGQIVNVSSIAGVEIPTSYYHTVYSATKFAIQGFSESLSKEFEGKNLRVMGYYPGGMSTKFFTKAGMDYKENEEWMFDPMQSVEAILFMLTRDPKINVKRMDLINHLS